MNTCYPPDPDRTENKQQQFSILFSLLFCTMFLRRAVSSSLNPTATAASRRSLFTVVDQATVAYRSTLGMTRVKLEAGIRLNIPAIHKLERVDMRKQRIDIRHLVAITKDNVQVDVTGTLFFQVDNPHDALFKVHDYVGSVERVGTSALRSILGKREYDQINSMRSDLNADLVKAIDKDTDQWGIKCNMFEIQDIQPISREVVKHLESQMEAERHRRRNELETQASINTAEGKKRSAILEAEGELTAQRYKADAVAYAIDTESSASARRIRLISEALGTRDPALISQFLIEQTKQQHLATLAKNALSSTYFFPEGSMLPSAKMMGDLFNKKPLELVPVPSEKK